MKTSTLRIFDRAQLGEVDRQPPRRNSGTPWLGQQVGDCHCAYSEDCELEHQGEPMIWFEPVDADKQYRSDGQDHDGVSESQHSAGGENPYSARNIF